MKFFKGLRIQLKVDSSIPPSLQGRYARVTEKIPDDHALRVKLGIEHLTWIAKVEDGSNLHGLTLYINEASGIPVLPGGHRNGFVTLPNLLRRYHVDPKAILGDDGG
jgi:hypothetical protein